MKIPALVRDTDLAWPSHAGRPAKVVKPKPPSTYDMNYKIASDEQLRLKPDKVMTAMSMFTCTVATYLLNCKIPFVQFMTEEFPKMQPTAGCKVLAINSNLGHCAQPDGEGYIKEPEEVAVTNGGAVAVAAALNKALVRVRKARTPQGDGTSFNSALEPVMTISVGNKFMTDSGERDLPEGKVYFLKFFPATGHTQVAGVLYEDKCDAQAAIQAWVDFLNERGVGVRPPAAVAPDAAVMPTAAVPAPAIALKKENIAITMINYKFCIIMHSPRNIVDIQTLGMYMAALESNHLFANSEARLMQARQDIPANTHLITPPYRILEATVTQSGDDVKFTCKVVIPPSDADGKAIEARIKVFQSGKTNILGMKSGESAHTVYTYLARLFDANWGEFIALIPRTDKEMLQYRDVQDRGYGAILDMDTVDAEEKTKLLRMHADARIRVAVAKNKEPLTAEQLTAQQFATALHDSDAD
jgi:hypothetical protein